MRVPRRPLTPCSGNYYYSPLMSKPLPERINPLRLCRLGETLTGSMALEHMPRFAEMLHQAAGRVVLELRFERDDGGRSCVGGRIDASVVVVCQRCLEPMPIDIEREVSLALVDGDDEAAALDTRYDPLVVGEEPLSLPGLVEDELILALPNFSRHPRGACSMPPGAYRNNGDDGARETKDADGESPSGESGEENPFSVLESYKSRKSSR